VFQLDSNYCPKRRKVRGQNNPNKRQQVLFTGLGLLPGQNNLFQTDGTFPKGDPPCSPANSPDSATSGTAFFTAAEGG
jgi:hypothetical protein